MKILRLLVSVLVVSCGLVSCNEYGDLYFTRPQPDAGTFTPYGPPAYASPSYVSSLVGVGSQTSGSMAYRYGSSGDMRTVHYRAIPSPKGSYHHVFHDSAQPLPPPNTVMKAKTWCYTSRWPSIWGAPIWVSQYAPTYSSRWARSPSGPPR